MDEKKKSESSWEEAERLGPYQLHEQVPQSAPGRGELYRATHETSGATALVFKPAAEKDAVPLQDWRVCITSSASSGCIAMEVVESPWSLAPNKHVMEALVFLFEGVHKAVGYMARAIPEDYELRSRWRLVLGAASAAAVCALLFALVRLSPVSPPAPGSDEVPTATEKPSSFRAYLADTAPQEQFVFAWPLPREPFKGQKRPPCNRRSEVELVGGCWAPHKLKAPCPEDLFEYQGECYIPAFSAKPPPQSLGR
jgi:hypothetical protein